MFNPVGWGWSSRIPILKKIWVLGWTNPILRNEYAVYLPQLYESDSRYMIAIGDAAIAVGHRQTPFCVFGPDLPVLAATCKNERWSRRCWLHPKLSTKIPESTTFHIRINTEVNIFEL